MLKLWFQSSLADLSHISFLLHLICSSHRVLPGMSCVGLIWGFWAIIARTWLKEVKYAVQQMKGLIKAKSFQASFVDNGVTGRDLLRSLNISACLNPYLAALSEAFLELLALSASPGSTFS